MTSCLPATTLCRFVRGDGTAPGMKLLLPLLLGAAAAAVRVAAQPQAFDCPSSSCWCGDSFSEDQVELRPEIYYRTAFNRVTQANQTLFLDE